MKPCFLKTHTHTTCVTYQIKTPMVMLTIGSCIFVFFHAKNEVPRFDHPWFLGKRCVNEGLTVGLEGCSKEEVKRAFKRMTPAERWAQRMQDAQNQVCWSIANADVTMQSVYIISVCFNRSK